MPNQKQLRKVPFEFGFFVFFFFVFFLNMYFKLVLSISNIEQSLPQISYYIAGNFAVNIFRSLHCRESIWWGVGGEKVFAKAAEIRICGAKNTCNRGKGST